MKVIDHLHRCIVLQLFDCGCTLFVLIKHFKAGVDLKSITKVVLCLFLQFCIDPCMCVCVF